MKKNKTNKLAMMIAILIGTVVLFVGTDGFRAFTAESARTYDLMKNQPKFPTITLEDSKENTFSFDDFAKDKYVFITFMYTSCTTVCPRLEMNMAKVYEQVPSQYLGKDIVFLSISFDPTRDNPEVLEKYRTYFGSDGVTWKMARIPNQAELDRLLKEFGVIVIPDGNGNFTHNSAFYLVDKRGNLVEVMDYTKIDEASKKVINILENEAGNK